MNFFKYYKTQITKSNKQVMQLRFDMKTKQNSYFDVLNLHKIYS